MTYFAGTLGATLDKGLTLNPETAPPPGPAAGYATTVTNLAGGGPLAYWRLGSISQATDAVGTRHGTYSGTVALAESLPQNSDGSVDFGGTGAALVTHDSGLSLAAFSLSFWFKANSFPAEASRFPLVTKDGAGLFNGDFNVTVEPAGEIFVQFQSTTQVFTLESAALVELGATHHVVVRADSTGFDCYVDGQNIGKLTTFTDAWASNTQDIRFASAGWFAAAPGSDVIIDEVALYSRVITQANVLSLQQNAGDAPVAANATATVPESATTIITLPPECTFVGLKSALTVTPTTPTPGSDSVSVNANKDFSYVAGSVASDTARSFTYTITDANGTSNSATISVTVQNSSTPVVSNANCFVIGTGGVVSSMSNLQSAVNSASPGDDILIAPGSYSGSDLTFTRDGTQANPIVIRPQNGLGTVTISGGNWTISASSSWLTFAQLHCDNLSFTLQGEHNRITRCRFRNETGSTIFLDPAGGNRDCRIDHCDSANHSSGAANANFINYRGAVTWADGTSARLLIDHCYFHDYNTGYVSFGFGSSTSDGPARGQSIIWDKCLFQNIDPFQTSPTPSNEFILNKIGGMVYKFCTFNNINGLFQWRQASHGEVRSCWFESIKQSMMWADDHLVIGNRFVGSVDCWVPAGNATWAQMLSGAAPGNSYSPARIHKYIGNQLGSGHLRLGIFHSGCTAGGQACDEPARNNLFEVNTRDSGGAAHEVVTTCLNPSHVSSTFNSTASMAFTAATKIPTPAGNSSDQVGLRAPDPYCPSGPQT